MHLIIHTAQYEQSTQHKNTLQSYFICHCLKLQNTRKHKHKQTLTTDQSIYTDDIHLVTARNNDFARFTQITQTERGTET